MQFKAGMQKVRQLPSGWIFKETFCTKTASKPFGVCSKYLYGNHPRAQWADGSDQRQRQYTWHLPCVKPLRIQSETYKMDIDDTALTSSCHPTTSCTIVALAGWVLPWCRAGLRAASPGSKRGCSAGRPDDPPAPRYSAWGDRGSPTTSMGTLDRYPGHLSSSMMTGSSLATISWYDSPPGYLQPRIHKSKLSSVWLRLIVSTPVGQLVVFPGSKLCWELGSYLR